MAGISDRMNAGESCLQRGDLAGAERAFLEVLNSDPAHGDALRLLGNLRRAVGRLEEAEACYRQLLKVWPDDAEASLQLGNLRYRQGRLEEAEACYRDALRLRPDHAESHNNLGATLADQNRWEEAEGCYQEALRLRPDYADAHFNLGNTLRQRGRLTEAERCYRAALSGSPHLSDLHNNLGIVLNDLGRLEEAEACYRVALTLQPDHAEVHNNLGATLVEQGRLAEAEACYIAALRLRPDYADAHHNRALILLLRGCYGAGWPAYEWRWRRAGFHPPRFSRPVWDGSSLDGRTILLYAEQGAGDVLQFVRYVALVRRMGGRVLLAAPRHLWPILSWGPGVDRLVALDEPAPPFDVHASMMSLPGILGTTVETIPATIPYLFPDPERVERWRRELETIRGLRIGIAWSGNPSNPYNRRRAIPLRHFASLARQPEVRLISLQKPAAGVESLSDDIGPLDILDRAGELDRTAAFVDTAAVMLNLDLVVACDSALAHLAGALGVPVWLPLPFIPDWRWLLDREDSPWYPTMKLFRQSRRGDWDEPFRRMAELLEVRVSRTGERRRIVHEIAPGELIDRLTILEIKSRRIGDPEKLRHVRLERAQLSTIGARRSNRRPGSPRVPPSWSP